jgi:hypothetical protein
VDELVEFLRARLDKDAAMAIAASPGPWSVGGVADDIGAADVVSDGGSVTSNRENPCCSIEDAAHIAHHDPDRALREVERDRRIIEEHGIVHRNIGWLSYGDETYDEVPVCGLCVPKHSHYPRREDVPVGPCLTVRLLALPYADHPDYREAWRP